MSSLSIRIHLYYKYVLNSGVNKPIGLLFHINQSTLCYFRIYILVRVMSFLYNFLQGLWLPSGVFREFSNSNNILFTNWRKFLKLTTLYLHSFSNSSSRQFQGFKWKPSCLNGDSFDLIKDIMIPDVRLK